MTKFQSRHELPQIYCDMDGVLADFKTGAQKTTGVKIDKWMDLSSRDKWDPIKKNKYFWSTLPWQSGGKQLWSFIRKYNPDILSAHVKVSIDPNCIPGKLLWCRKNLGLGSNRVNLVLRSQNSNYAQTGKNTPAILIDDFPKNVREFTARGGIGIYHSSSSNTISKLKKLGF